MSSKKMGRPPSDNPKTETIRIRVDQATLSKLDACTKKLSTTRSDIVRRGIEKVFLLLATPLLTDNQFPHRHGFDT